MLCHWVELVAYGSLVVEIEFLAIWIWHQFQIVILLAFLPIKGEVSQQAGFIALRTPCGIALYERLRQSLCKETELIHIARKPVSCVGGGHVTILVQFVVAGSTDEWVSAADATKRVGSKRGTQCLIHIDVGHIERTVHRHG